MFQRQISRIVLFCLVVLAAHGALAGDWPQFRGPGSLGVSQEKGLAVTWSDTQNMAWKTAMPGYGASSPIAIGDKLYVTCYSGYGTGASSGKMEDLMLHLVCVGADDGKIVWDKKIKPTLPESSRVKDHGYAAGTPATDGKHIYIFFGKTGVLKFDLAGEQIWQTSVGEKTHGWGCGTSPVLYEKLVIVNASVESGALVAINKETGKEAWRAEGMNSSWNTPHLVQTSDGKTELAVSVKGSILGYDPASGKQLWRCEGVDDYICPSIISQEGVLYALGGRSSQAIAIRSGGRGDVTATHKVWHAKVGSNVCSPVIHDGHLYWVSDRNNVAYCLSLEDGSIKYSQEVDIQPYASAMLADGKLYVVTRSGGALVLAATPKFQQLAHNKLADKSTFNASAIAVDGKLFLRSDECLYCIKKAD